MDLTTHWMVGAELHRIENKATQCMSQETAVDCVQTLLVSWIQDKPRPKLWIADNAKAFSSHEFATKAAELGIGEHLTQGQAP